MQNNFFTLILLTLVFCGCSKKDLNLPQPSPMPGRESVQTEYSACEFVFTQEQSWSEVAIVANEMQQRCGYSKSQVLSLARDFSENYSTAGARVISEAKNPVFFQEIK